MAGVVRPWLRFQTSRNSGKPISSSIASSEELRQKPERQPAEGANEAGERGDEAAVDLGHALVDEIEAGAELGMRRPHLLLKGEHLAVLPLGSFAALPLVTVERRFRRGPRRAERRAHGGFLRYLLQPPPLSLPGLTRQSSGMDRRKVSGCPAQGRA